MATLKELVDKHGFGKVMTKTEEWRGHIYFTPMYKLGNKFHGYYDNEVPVALDITSNDWELYKEFKKKVKMYKYSYKANINTGVYETFKFYKDDNHFLSDISKHLDILWYQKLKWSEIEVEE